MSEISINTALEDQQREEQLNIKRFQSAQMIFISLFTAMLAFFLLMISVIEIETQPHKRLLQKTNLALYQELQQQKKQEGLTWLHIENTVSKGVKLSIDPKEFVSQQLFFSARARVNPYFLPYIERLSTVLNRVDLNHFAQRHPSLINRLVQPGEVFRFTIRIEGHTDSNPLAKTALYQSNLELSSFRAYAIMDLIKIYTQIPPEQFAIAGYGSFRPLTEDSKEAINRRVELYIYPDISPISPEYLEVKGE